jgi:hypothetical protein
MSSAPLARHRSWFAGLSTDRPHRAEPAGLADAVRMEIASIGWSQALAAHAALALEREAEVHRAHETALSRSG